MSKDTEQAVIRSHVIQVLGEPKGQPRARSFAFVPKAGGRPIVRVYDSGTAEGWKSAIAAESRKHITSPFDGPVDLNVMLYMPRPKSHYRTGKNAHELRDDAPMFHVGKPDADNLAKAIMDALTQIGAWRDDCQVARLKITKKYGPQPGAFISISSMHDEEISDTRWRQQHDD